MNKQTDATSRMLKIKIIKPFSVQLIALTLLTEESVSEEEGKKKKKKKNGPCKVGWSSVTVTSVTDERERENNNQSKSSIPIYKLSVLWLKNKPKLFW